jgi:hypothetical protein
VIGVSDCPSPRVAMPQRDHMRLVWREPYQGVTRLRVITWTCCCRAAPYELCQTAGQAFIRRTLQLDGDRQVHEFLKRPERH